MIGNDIISLKVIRSHPRAERPAYLSRVLTPAEKGQLEKADDRELLLWKFWALKESAYKLEFKRSRKRSFAPKKFDCRIDRPNEEWSEALVRSPHALLAGKVWHNERVIHALVASSRSELNQIKFGTTFISSDEARMQSRSVRQLLQKMLSIKYGLPENKLILQKEEGIPVIAIEDRELSLDISLSHHGHWGAVSFLQKN